MQVRPIGDHLLIKRLAPNGVKASLHDPTTLVKSNIVLPDSWVAKPIRGVVVAIGRGTLSAMGHLIPMTVTEGDIVWFDHRAGSEFKVGNETLLIIKESELFAVEG